MSGGTAHLTLAVLTFVYLLNLLDRNLLSILAEDVKASLHISDAQMGVLYGTVFAVFYAVFGIPLARVADVWVRRSLIAMGVLLWSLMTVLSGFCGSFTALALCRIGVGIGEATATPAGASMLGDLYPPHMRATVLSLYGSGVFLGLGLGLGVGGFILAGWKRAFPEPATDAPLGMEAWQAAFVLIGAPGIVVSAIVRALPEPQRGADGGARAPTHGLASGVARGGATMRGRDVVDAVHGITSDSELLAADTDDAGSDGASSAGLGKGRRRSARPCAVVWDELVALTPGLNWGHLRASGMLRANVAAASVFSITAAALVHATGDATQWAALGAALYLTVGWAQALRARDRPTYAMIFGSEAVRSVLLISAPMGFVAYTFAFWTAPLLMRLHPSVSRAYLGKWLGLGTACGGLIGSVVSGTLSDRLKLRHPAGRVLVPLLSIALEVPLKICIMYAPSLDAACGLHFLRSISGALWLSMAPSVLTELVLPRMRATAVALNILVVTLAGSASGPYACGLLSDRLVARGHSQADALRTAMMCALAVYPLVAMATWRAWRTVPAAERSRFDRAASFGERAVELPAVALVGMDPSEAW